MIRVTPMKRWIKDWDELCGYERVFRIGTLLLSAVTIVLSLLVLVKVLPIWTALLGLAGVQFCQAIYSWNNQRNISLFSLFSGTVVLAVMVAMLFLD